jgi:site-specific recombinase XerD
MDTDVSKLAAQALELLREQGMSPKAVWEYKQYGFKPIIQHFKQNRVVFYSISETNSFVKAARLSFEKGNLMKWKWLRIRKASVFMESLYSTGALNMTPLIPWAVEHNPLRQTPTEKQLNEADNIVALAYHVKMGVREFHVSEGVLKAYGYYGFEPLLRYYRRNKTEKYDVMLMRRFLDQQKKMFEKGAIHETAYQNARKVIWMIEEYRKTGIVRWQHQPRMDLRPTNSYFTEIWDKFQAENGGVLSEASFNTIRSAVRRFVLMLEDKGACSFAEVSQKHVSDCITKMAAQYSGGQNALVFSLRTFLRFLKTSGITDTDLSIAVPELVAPRRTVLSGFSDDELKQLLGSPNVDTPVGKRDYAIMMIAVQTGLRAVDITNLKRSDVDWHSNEIRIVQHKTKRPLSLPLRAEAGNAIADYLLNGRPESDLPQIFLCATQPIRPMGHYSVSRVVTAHMHHTGVPKNTRRGSHSFRRAFGKNLLEAQTPLDMLSELLGHTHPNSSRPYLAMNEKELKLCALSLRSIEKAGENL